MPNNVLICYGWVTGLQGPNQQGQFTVLYQLKRVFFITFKLNTDGKIVALVYILPLADSSMPGPLVNWYILGQKAVALDEKVGGDLESGDLLVKWVGIGIKAAQKQVIHPTTAKLSRR